MISYDLLHLFYYCMLDDSRSTQIHLKSQDLEQHSTLGWRTKLWINILTKKVEEGGVKGRKSGRSEGFRFHVYYHYIISCINLIFWWYLSISSSPLRSNIFTICTSYLGHPEDKYFSLASMKYTLFFISTAIFWPRLICCLGIMKKKAQNLPNCCLVIYSGQNQKMIFASNLILNCIALYIGYWTRKNRKHKNLCGFL